MNGGVSQRKPGLPKVNAGTRLAFGCAAGWWNCVQPGFPLTDAGVPAIIISVHARIRCQRQPVQTGIARELNGISRQPRWSS